MIGLEDGVEEPLEALRGQSPHLGLEGVVEVKRLGDDPTNRMVERM